MNGKQVLKGWLMAMLVVGLSLFATVSGFADEKGPTGKNDQNAYLAGYDIDSGEYLKIIGRVLDLNEEQVEVIQDIHAREWKNIPTLYGDLAMIQSQMTDLTDADYPDESAIRALAMQQAEIETQLVVSQARVKNQVFAVLSLEQRALARKIKPLLML